MLLDLARVTIFWVPLASLCQAAAPDLQQPPAILPPDLTAPSLVADSAGHPLSSAKDWPEQRAKIKRQWQAVLGEFPPAKAPLKTSILSTETLDDYNRSLVSYQVEEGIYTDGYLLVPNGAGQKLPAVVVFHPTTPLHAKAVAGVDPAYPSHKQQGVQLARRGFVVWCPRNYINADGADWAGNARLVTTTHPRWTGMTRMVWDAIRAVDFLQSLPQVDPERIGCVGHSLGAKVVLYAMAFDERYKAGVFSEGGMGLRFSNWDAPWYLGPKIREPDFHLENDWILALVAPRAFLLLAGDSAYGDRSWSFIKAVQPVYKLLDAPRNVGWWNHHRGHDYPPEVRELAENFLEQHLGPPGAVSLPHAPKR